jgi:hypothetical protein
MNTIKRYDAYLTFSKLTSEKQDAIRQLMDAQGLDVDLFDNALEFSFEGRDVNDKVVEVFAQIDVLLHEASGEIRCEIDDDDYQDPTFEFFSITDSHLWKQSGKIVRTEHKSLVQ